MNIFYLDRHPKTCAEMHLDKHVVKMIIEYAQPMVKNILIRPQMVEKLSVGVYMMTVKVV